MLGFDLSIVQLYCRMPAEPLLAYRYRARHRPGISRCVRVALSRDDIYHDAFIWSVDTYTVSHAFAFYRAMAAAVEVSSLRRGCFCAQDAEERRAGWAEASKKK